jgi:hypothetical protein
MGIPIGAILVVAVVAYALSIDPSGCLAGLCLVGFALVGGAAESGEHDEEGD